MENYYLQNNGKDWELRKEGAERASKLFAGSNKKEAIKAAAEFMNGHGGSMKIRKLNGQFEEERTYPRSEDPTSSKG